MRDRLIFRPIRLWIVFAYDGNTYTIQPFDFSTLLPLNRTALQPNMLGPALVLSATAALAPCDVATHSV